ncbi:MAG: hypothetical protein M3Y22_16155 [Pseudomonadota bacterium]|nr:hypothetical protein [Pseudomonadota bacterium]
MSQTNQPYDVDDPRLAKIINKYDKRYGPEATKDAAGQPPADYLSAILRTFDAPDRRGQSSRSAYHEAIEAFTKDKVKDSQIVFQDDDWTPIKISQLKPNLDREPSGWVRFIKVKQDHKSRLYIPSSLMANAVKTICTFLWSHSQVLCFKIVGYGNAVNRADVIVAWFGDVNHARPVGEKVEQLFANLLSGQRPVGAFPCTTAGLCGWAPEIGVSVGANIRQDILNRWSS